MKRDGISSTPIGARTILKPKSALRRRKQPLADVTNLDIDVTDARNLSTTARAEIGFDFEPSEE